MFENRSHDEGIDLRSCMKERIWIVLMIVLMIYRYENQVWKYVYRLGKELWFEYIFMIQIVAMVAILRSKPQPFASQPQPKPLGSKPKPKPCMEVSA
jgi:hypothetical protein